MDETNQDEAGVSEDLEDQSIHESLMNIDLGDEDDDEGEGDEEEAPKKKVTPETDETEDEEDEEPERFTVKINGKEQEVTLEELRAGYQKGADYQQKTQTLAEQRRQVEQERSAVLQERQQYANGLKQLDGQINASLEAYDQIDWDALRRDDPMEYMARREERRELADKQKEGRENMARLQYQQQVDQQQNLSRLLKDEQSALSEKMPEFKDPAKASALMTKLRAFGISQGFQESEINGLTDHRSVVVLDKARKYDELMKADPARKKIKDVPKMTRPGSPKGKSQIASESYKKTINRSRQTGNIDDAAAAILVMNFD